MSSGAFMETPKPKLGEAKPAAQGVSRQREMTGVDVDRTLINPIAGFTWLHTQVTEIFTFTALRLSSLHVIYRSIAAHLWMGWRDGCERRTIVKTKTISTALQAANAPVGVHKVAGVAGLYLKIGETGAGSYFYRYRARRPAARDRPRRPR